MRSVLLSLRPLHITKPLCMLKKMEMKNRYHINTYGNDDEAYGEAVRYACDYANSNKNEEFEIIFLISKMGSTGWIERLFGENEAKDMINGVSYNDCRASIKTITQRNFSNYCSADGSKLIVFIPGANMNKIRIVEDHFEVETIIAIPWLDSAIDDWIKGHYPQELRGVENTKYCQELNPILKFALDNLTNSINFNTGISHPDDNYKAKTTVLVLTKYQNDLNASQIESYLVDSNWKALYAKELCDLIRTIQSGKSFKGGSRSGLEQKYNFWKKSVDK